MKTLIILAASALLHLSGFAQFQLRYATPNYDWAASLDIDQKNGYVIAGSSLSGTWSPSLMRVDVNGALQWSYIYNQPGIDEHFWDVTSVDWDSEPIYATVGSADAVPGGTTSFDIYFLMVSGSGVPISAKRFLTKEGDVGRHIEPIVHPLYGNGFVVTGYTYHSLTTQEKDINVLITDKFGNLMKSAVLLAPLDQEARWIESTKDGGFIIIGETQLKQTCDKKEVNVLIVRLDSQLKVLWSYTYDLIPEKGNSDDRAYVAKEDPNGEIQIAGTSKIYINNVYDHDEPFQMHLKNDGTPVWLKAYNVDTYPSAEVVSLINKTLDDGSIINVLSGRTYQNFEALLFETDYDGEPTWSRTYPPNYSVSTTRAEDLTENEIKGYSFTGRMLNASAPSPSYDFHLVKTDGNGKSGEACEKEVKTISHKLQLCQDKIRFDVTPMRELKISTDNIKLDLKIKKCQDGSSSSIQAPAISPNPGENFITIADYVEGSNVSIYDLQGLLKKQSNSITNSKFDISDLPPGIYIVEIANAEGVVNKYRFVKK